MANSNPFGAHSTADKVLAGIDLSGKHIVVTGCNSGIGFATMSALAANGAHVIGLAKTLDAAREACAKAGPSCTAVACDLSDLGSIASAADTVRGLQVPLDAIVANAAVANLPKLQTRYGVELQFLVNHIGHFALTTGLLDAVRDGTGRIVVVSGAVGKSSAPAEGIMFDNLDGHRFYKPLVFYGQSKFANALYAKELSRRLSDRRIAVNSLHPGATKGTNLNRHLGLSARIGLATAQLWMKSMQHGAATQTLLAASPRVAGISGQYWANCQITAGNLLLEDAALATRLWDVSAELVAQHGARDPKTLAQAA